MAGQVQFDYEGRWTHLARSTYEKLKAEGMPDSRELRHTALHTALKAFLLECYSEDMRQRLATPWAPLEGREGAELKAVEIHHWLPETVRNMTDDDLFFALQAQIMGHSFTGDVYQAIRGLFGSSGALHHIDQLAPPPADAS